VAELAGERQYAVTAGAPETAHWEAVQAAVMGARRELGRASALGSSFPQMTVEILRIDERAAGIRDVDGSGPLESGSVLLVTGRAYVLETSGSRTPSIDTGDMTRRVVFASSASASEQAAARSRAIREAATELGSALARAVLGLPEPARG
jgi:hypothetical protein